VVEQEERLQGIERRARKRRADLEACAFEHANGRYATSGWIAVT
jgi:hypothetical protein